MDFVAFKDWALLGLLSGAIYILYQVARSVTNSLDKVNNSVDKLNVHMAVVLDRTLDHGERIKKLESEK